MVKISSPLMSNSASGKIGERLVFSKRKSGQQARFQKAQADVITDDRLAQRDRYAVCVLSWKSIDPVVKALYNSRAEILGISGYNLYMRECLLSGGDTSTQSYYGVRIYGKLLYGNTS